jgi:hypothetical protein
MNPFDPSHILVDERGVFGDSAKLVQRGLLRRVIDFEQPFQGRLIYDGKWFRQKVEINGAPAWYRVSWLRIHRKLEFRLPAGLSDLPSQCRIDIDFGIGLSIRRFQVTIGGIVFYDEIC